MAFNAKDKRRAWMSALKGSAVSRPLDPSVMRLLSTNLMPTELLPNTILLLLLKPLYVVQSLE